jgi:hypothetical protein
MLSTIFMLEQELGNCSLSSPCYGNCPPTPCFFIEYTPNPPAFGQEKQAPPFFTTEPFRKADSLMQCQVEQVMVLRTLQTGSGAFRVQHL